jgi:hypothetical protein
VQFKKILFAIGLVLIPQMAFSDEFLSEESARKLVRNFVFYDSQRLKAESSIGTISFIPMHSNYETASKEIMFTVKPHIGEVKFSLDPDKIEFVSEKHPQPGQIYLTGQTGHFLPTAMNKQPVKPVSIFTFFIKKQALAITLATYTDDTSVSLHQARYVEVEDLSVF